ncbi:putative quinol monooxygenase [Aeromonas simiae]|uniref:Antibiotic biosynthesis monooxygenase n=1 Tax=Aeromonas simiae TaxID=218936 RepID=A0A5J6WX97_9GAMM|nr:putative quinol monooxygenase [Aeromonas simiae]QFI54934.1 antibiotic biosynthesis monooxygenase [Aeromonas simiae]
MSTVIVIARLVAQPGQGESLHRALQPLMEATRAEPGCLAYDLHQERDNPDAWMLFERWESDAALAAHNQAPHLAHFATTFGATLVERDVRYYHPLSR